MADPATLIPMPTEPCRQAPRGRWIAFLTLVMAGAYLGAADLAVNGGDRYGLAWDGVHRINSTRILLQAMLPSESGVSERSSLPSFLPGAGSRGITSEQRERHARLQREIGAVEVVTYVWQRMVWTLAACLVLVSILSWITRWGRFWHLLGALSILLATGLTLAAVRYLDISDGSGLSIWPLSPWRYEAVLQYLAGFAAGGESGRSASLPTGGGMGTLLLAARTYVGIGAAFSAYGWFLLLALGRSRGSRSSHSAAHVTTTRST